MTTTTEKIQTNKQRSPEGIRFLPSPFQKQTVRLSTMDRSTQELFLNFMIVLITVLLMWLLVKTYQD
ncbi:hypothetical protein OJAV_G00128010 [Oryzias javanicus]|uniref:Sarcolipin n=1 Tax=Oryzias javanicus TaxID=123683 RepID=A0A3S2MQE8_ORYJA|nr:hypothetical protein OJAV_G00128010 [Oryzias javanicus]